MGTDTREAGRRGGLARAKKMTKKQRSDSARKAALSKHRKKALTPEEIEARERELDR